MSPVLSYGPAVLGARPVSRGAIQIGGHEDGDSDRDDSACIMAWLP